MGRPAHYSMDLVARFRSLLEHLTPIVGEGLPDDARFGGTLTTTFLLAMATPMIGLPVERIFKPNQRGDIIADDTALNDRLTREVLRVFDDRLTFAKAPFKGKTDWRLLRNVPPFNIAVWEAGQHFEALSSEQARTTAERATTRFMLAHIRNALAHGGVAYLDTNGQMHNQRAEMLAFASAKKEYETGKIIGLHISRVSEADFFTFLRSWGDWIEQSGVGEELTADPLLAA